MATEYNSNNPPFTTRQQMELYQGSMSVKPSLSACHYVECRRNLTPYQTLYVRSSHFVNDPQLGPLQNYDIGQFTIATCNTTSGILGELWVKYDVTLKKPKLSLVNQPYLTALDLAIPPTGTTMSVPAPTRGLLQFTTGNEQWTLASTLKYYPENPAKAWTTVQPNSKRDVGCDILIGATDPFNIIRFPDEAPVGTILRFTLTFRMATDGTGTYTWIPPALSNTTTFPPGQNQIVGCAALHYARTPAVNIGNNGANQDFIIDLVLQRQSNATVGVNQPWAWCPGVFTGTIVANCSCSAKSITVSYCGTGLGAGVSGAPVGTILW